MRAKDRLWKSLSFLIVVVLLDGNPSDAQERVTVSYSSLEAPNSNYFIGPPRRGCVPINCGFTSHHSLIS